MEGIMRQQIAFLSKNERSSLEGVPTEFELSVDDDLKESEGNDADNLYDDPERSFDSEYSLSIGTLRPLLKLPLLTPHEEFELGMRVQHSMGRKRLDAANTLIEHNIRLVTKSARSFLGLSLSFDDLFQEGILGLQKAAYKFDPEYRPKGKKKEKEAACLHKQGKPTYRFSTIATWWIKQSIRRGVSNDSRLIRIPVHIWDMLHKIDETKKRLMQEYDTNILWEEDVARELGISVSDLYLFLQMNKMPISVYNSIQRAEEGDEELELQHILPGPFPTPDLTIWRRDMLRMIKPILEKLYRDSEAGDSVLGYRNAQILAEYAQEDHGTYEDIGRVHGCVTRERIRQIIMQTLASLEQNRKEGKYPILRDIPINVELLRALTIYIEDLRDLLGGES